jgi:hypothetical protein
MCPFCLANVAMLAAGVTSTGGLTALIAGKLRSKSKTREISSNFKQRIRSRVHPARQHRYLAENVSGQSRTSSRENC